jgi:hypothetical protein
MRRSFSSRKTEPTSQAGVMTYAICPTPGCGDPVAGRIPQAPEELKLTCVHCKQTFAFEPGDLQRGLVSYDRLTKRWKVETYSF